MTNLSQKKCVACEEGTLPLTEHDATVLLEQVNDWKLSEDVKSISKDFKFADFKEALAFVNKVGAIAEEEGHHPDITFTWGKAKITLSTHSIGGLSENDFIEAAKIDEIES